MRKLVILIITIILSTPAFAQLEVKEGSFHKVDGFVNLNMDKQTDDNDQPYAVLKIRTENIDGKQRRQLDFKGDARTFFEVEYRDGEVWLYISYYASYIKISHDDLSSTEFYFPFDMEPNCCYELTLVNKMTVSEAPAKEQFNYMIIKADQPTAVICIDGQYAGDGEAAKSFKVGETHQWSIECELYHPESGSATIVKDNPVTIDKKLRPAYGFINITSLPESGATVFVDNKRVGETPCTTNKLASGEHNVRVMKEMYLAAEQTFIVTDGNTTQAKMTMTANFVAVNVTTDSQSDIYVDNEKKGKGSWSGRLSAGDHVFEAKKASHKTTVKNMTFALGENASVVIPNPMPIYGTLDINSSPMGATIVIDGKNYGTTPRVLSEILIGSHELRLEKSDCAPMTKTITLDEKNTLSLNEKLETGREISISTDKSGDMVYVDGDYIGTSPMTTTLSFGEHNVKAVRNNRESSKMITVAQTGGETSVQLTFLTNKTFTVNGITFEMIAINGGTFTMGCTSYDCGNDESPHSVTLSNFYIGKFEVTQELWYTVMGSNPSYFKGTKLPVEQVSWNDVQEFIRKLNQKTGANFRLPTEAEWEYAARGGTNTSLYNGENINIKGNFNSPNLDKLAWYGGNCGQNYTATAGCDVSQGYDISRWNEKQYNDSKGGTHPIGLKLPNAYGLYDMLGNVWEWCQDWWGGYSSSSQTNPAGPSSGTARVYRGGSWNDYAEDCRVSNRDGANPVNNGYYGPYMRNNSLGFRLALGINDESSANMTNLPEGSVMGVFSVSSNKKVKFSQGNLQYQASTKTWRFAEHQWDIVGDSNKNISSNYSGWIDLFDWGTSGYNGKNPWMTSTTSTDYGNGERDIAETNYDWGVYNTISNGDDKRWRTLTRDEWVYVFDTRNTSSGIRYAKTTVNGVDGVILLPDNWSSSNYSLSNTNKTDASFSSNRISQTDWNNKFEANGAVFLPAAGYRMVDVVDIKSSHGSYWSASYRDSGAYELHFWNGNLDPDSWGRRNYGRSVRLVCPAED